MWYSLIRGLFIKRCRLINHIYVFLFPNGKRYVGQAIRSVAQRESRHWCDTKMGCSLPVHNAMRKYGKDNVKLEVLTLRCTQEYLDFIEDRSIIAFNALVPNGYNLKRGGAHGALNEETKAKISAAHKGKCPSEETRARMSISQRGRHHSEETKAKMSLAHMGKQGRPAWNKGKLGSTGRGHSGKKHSAEARAKMSAAHKGKIPWNKGRSCSDETKAKLSVINRGKVLSEETRMKISKAGMGRYHSEESRAKMSAAKRGKPGHRAWNKGKYGGNRSEETKAKIAATMKRLWQEKRN